MRKLLTATAVAALGFAGAASADTAAVAGTDLNLREGPGVWHDVVGVITGGDDVSVKGCIADANWCEVTYGELTGWAYGDYLAAKVGEEFQPLYPNREEVGVAVIEAPAVDPAREGQNTAVGAGTGAAMGALIAGPLGAVVGGAIGGTAGHAATEPEPAVITYIEANPQEPVILDGEVVVGAGIPAEVTLYEIPDYAQYRYVVINNQPVLVDPESRQIVYIYR
ncbi:MAG: DUF1236 domain-containing protein [Paracoccus sp. (in: a-proteobacteria)]|nr:DUF1236 domain-containing protein [Paracoccus sp. (in: a-proteobacteria)]